MVAGLTILFALTFGSLVWLGRDVDRGVSNRSAAQSIAFQSARSGAQSSSVEDLRSGRSTLDVSAARSAIHGTAQRLFASYGVDGVVESIDVDPATTRVRVVVRIVDGDIAVTGTGIARAEVTP